MKADSTSLGVIFILNSIALFVFPHWVLLHLSQEILVGALLRFTTPVQ
jgi:hypothetical protein